MYEKPDIWSLPRQLSDVNYFVHLQAYPPSITRCGLTSSSSGAPTAWRLAREPVLSIIQLAGLAPCRWCSLNSHVRHHTTHSLGHTGRTPYPRTAAFPQQP